MVPLKGKNLQFFKQFVCKNSETGFQNAKTALSRIFFAKTGMDSAQKKPELDEQLQTQYFEKIESESILSKDWK